MNKIYVVTYGADHEGIWDFELFFEQTSAYVFAEETKTRLNSKRPWTSINNGSCVEEWTDGWQYVDIRLMEIN